MNIKYYDYDDTGKKSLHFNSPSLLFALNISSGAPSFCSSFFSFPSVLDSSGIADCSTLDLSKQKNFHKYKILFLLIDWLIHSLVEHFKMGFN